MARIDDYREAFRLASQELAKVNLHRICSLSGSSFIEDANGSPAISVPFMNQKHLIQVRPEVDVVREGNHEPVPIPEKILMLHYLLTARGDILTGNLITFRQVSEGQFYHSAFLKRARDPFVRTFGNDPQRLLVCGCELGAEPGELGDVSITLSVLPRIPVTLAIWSGDDELPPEGSLLFDESIVSYLPTEDIAVMSGMVVYRLLGISQRLP